MSLLKTVLTILVAFVIVFAYQLSKDFVASFLYSYDLYILGTILGFLISAAICYTLSALWVKFVLKMPLKTFRLAINKLNPVIVITSFAMPLFVYCLFMLFTKGKWSIDYFDTYNSILIVVIAVFDSALWAGICEEIVFRGMLLSAIELRWNRVLAVLITSFGFGAVHIMNGNMNIISFLQLLLGGGFVAILFSIVCINENNIWNNVLIHAVWNFTASMFAIVANNDTKLLNGVNPDFCFFRYDYNSSSNLITGGDFGFEASVLSIVGYALTIIAVGFYYKKRSKSLPQS